MSRWNPPSLKPPALIAVSELLARWVLWVVRYTRTTLGLLGVVTLLAGWVVSERFQVNSKLGDLIEQNASWRTDFDAYKAKFPQLIDTVFVVVSSTSTRDIETTTEALHAAMLSRPEQFQDVYAPGASNFFSTNALLYMEVDELEELIDQLAQAQPLLTAMAEDPSLRGLLELVRDGLENEGGAELERVARLLANSAELVVKGDQGRIRWSDEFFDDDELRYGLITLKGATDYGVALPNSATMANVRAQIASIDLPAGVDIALTGEVALAHEEIKAAQDGVQIAGMVSAVLLLIVLGVGVRSVRVIAATFGMLLIGVLWTSAYALLTVGEYNTLSLIFLVMFFGLGVDFAIHYCLCVQENLQTNLQQRTGPAALSRARVAESLAAATGSVGRALSLCALTSALGFLCFVPTDYQGLADLGIIAAGGMFIAAFLTFTLMPALFSWWRGPGLPHGAGRGFSTNPIVGYLVQRRVVVIGLVLAGAVIAGSVARDMSFDYSVLALRDPQSESMQTLRVLQREDIVTDYALSILSDETQLSTLEELVELDVVDKVTTPFAYVPAEQDEKLFILEDAQLILDSALNPARTLPSPGDAELKQEISSVLALIGPSASPDELVGVTELGDEQAAQLKPELDRLGSALAALVDRPEQVMRLQKAAITGLLEELDWVRAALAAQMIEFDDLPEDLRARLVSPQGEFHSIVLPSEDISNVDALSRFIEGTRANVPFATGRPVVEWGIGGIVVNAFTNALVLAGAGIALVLLLSLRSFPLTGMVLIPLVLTSVFTLAAAVLLDVRLNMANILVLPLIFGLGVDNGIHVVERYLGSSDVDQLMGSSTPRAVLLSTLTTIGTFAALALSPHQGTASIGYLLTIAMGFLLVFTLVLLPVLLSWLPKKAGSG